MSTNPDLRLTSSSCKLTQATMVAACVVGTTPMMAQENRETDPVSSFDLRQLEHRVEAYDGTVKTLACNPSTICLVKLECDEHIINTGLSSAAYWRMLSPIDHYLVPHSHVGFKPRSNTRPANAIMFTDKRIYELSLVIDNAESTSVLSFTYPGSDAGRAATDCTGTGATSDQ